MSSKIRIASVGLGWVAQHRHIPSILRHSDCELVGTIDRHEGLAEKVARRHKLERFAHTDTLDNVPWLDQVDALVIGAPPHAHAALTLSAFKHGKHVLTEKPFAMSLDEGEAMAQAARSSDRILAVVHNFQFSRAATKLKRDLDNGRLGPIVRVAATQLGNPNRRLPSWYETLPLGLFYDESPHFFYLIDSLSHGDLRLQRAHSVGQKGYNTPRLVHLLYQDDNGIPFTIDCQFDSTLSEWNLRVTGTKATAIVDIFRDIYLFLPNDTTHKATDILKTSWHAISQHVIQHLPNGLDLLRGCLDYGNDEIIDRFAKAIVSGKQPDKIGFEQALRILRLQHEATKALKETQFL